jgi:predicted enzyme related to lactoylglutathione lyase
MTSPYHINPRIRAYGKARIDITRRARSEKEWQEMWREPLNSLPFDLDSGWKFCFEYMVADYAAEVGFFIDVLGLPVRAFSPVFAQFSLPGDEFGFNVIAAQEDQEDTNPNTIRMQISVKDIERVVKTLESRGVAFERTLAPVDVGSSTTSACFRSPHGVCIELFGELRSSSPEVRSGIPYDALDEPAPDLEELLELPGEDDPEDDEQETNTEAEDRADDQEAMLEPEYVDEIPDDELEPAAASAHKASANTDEKHTGSRLMPADRSSGGYSPRSVPLNTLLQAQHQPREGSGRWPLHNDKRNGNSVFDETEIEE